MPQNLPEACQAYFPSVPDTSMCKQKGDGTNICRFFPLLSCNSSSCLDHKTSFI